MDISRACACACSSFLPDALDLSPVCWPPLLPPSADEEEEVGTDCSPARAIAAAALMASFGFMPVLGVLLLMFILEEEPYSETEDAQALRFVNDWLGMVADALLGLVVVRVIQIPQLKKGGCAQLAADLCEDVFARRF